MAMDYIKIFFDWLETTEDLNYTDKGRLIVAMIKYAKGEDYNMGDDGKAVLTGKAKTLFPTFRKKIDESVAAYEETVSRNRQNGSKGGRPKKTQQNPENPVGYLGFQKKPTKTQKSQEEEQEQDKEQEQDTTVTTLPSYPEREKYNNRWKTSTRARAATAQSVLDQMAERGDGAIHLADLHDVLFKAMTNGITPEELLDASGRMDAMMFSVWLYEKGVLGNEP